MTSDFEIVYSHVPAWRNVAHRLRLVALALGMFTMATLIMMSVDFLAPAWTALAHFSILLSGFALASPFFLRRKTHGAQWGTQAYQHAFERHIALGLPFIFASIAHLAYLAGERLIPNTWLPITSMLALYFFIVGVATWARSGLAIGADNALMLYVYYPHESRLVENALYGFIRHPMYAGLSQISLAFGLWRGTFWALLLAALMPFGFWIWLRWVEEPELLERFGAGYAAYRRATPAFFPPLTHLGRFWRYLVVGK